MKHNFEAEMDILLHEIDEAIDNIILLTNKKGTHFTIPEECFLMYIFVYKSIPFFIREGNLPRVEYRHCDKACNWK